MNRSKRTALVAFGALLVLIIGLVAATTGIGKISVPDGSVAIVDGVDGGEITSEEFDAGIAQAAASQGTAQPPEPGTPQFNAQKAPAMSELLLARWVSGEAQERGIEVTDREIDTELQTIIDEQFGGQKEFDRFVEQSGFSEEDVDDRVRLQLLTTCIQDQVVPQDPDNPTPPSREGCQGNREVEITQDQIQDFYDENISQFETPETRDVRTVLNPDEEKAQEAFDALSEDNSAASWKEVAADLSTDEATKDLGGLRQGVAAGQNEPALDEAIFAAEEDEVVGPIETDAGFYVLQVDKITPAETQPLDEDTTAQIKQSLVTQEQQEAVTQFQEDFIEKWRARTVCADSLLTGDTDGTVQSALAERCSNFSVTDDGCAIDDEGEEAPVDPNTGQVIEQTGCGAFVPQSPVTPPGGDTPLPQTPFVLPAAEALPAGAVPVGGTGAPGSVPVTPTTPPPGTVPGG